jgi:hypothetical protein
MTTPYSSHIQAIYEKGRLKLLRPIDLPEGAKVNITIHSEDSKEPSLTTPFLPANHLEALINLVSIGGDALTDS